MTVDLWVVFFTGLTVGGLSCLAIQGGLLAAALARPADGLPQQTGTVQLARSAWPVAYFLGAKLLAHAALGWLLGSLGAAAQITPGVQAAMQIGAGLYMVVVALNLLDAHPALRYLVIQPPRALTRMVRKQSRVQEAFTPALLGLLTVLIPCGATQAMMMLAISTGSASLGAAIMVVFVLGTMPVFVLLGLAATQARGRFERVLTRAAAALILVLGLLAINTGLNLAGSPLAPERLAASFLGVDTSAAGVARLVDGMQELTINVTNEAYVPGRLQADSGIPLRLRLITNNTYSCTLIFNVPDAGVWETLPITGETVIDLPAQSPGSLHFTCGMGMHNGTIQIVEPRPA